MADHLVDEPPNKRAKLRDPYPGAPDSADVFSNMDMFNLEKDLPDELMSSGTWGDQSGSGISSKPPAQGPGPGGQIQMNGDDTAALQRQLQMNHHLMQQQGNKSQLGSHPAMSMAALGNKSPNLQSPPNVAVSKDQMGGMHQNLLPNTQNQHHTSMPMSSMQAMNVSNVGAGGMIMTSSNMGGGVMGVTGVGMGSGALVVNNVNKQPPLLGPSLHAQHHNVPQGAMQNGPMLTRVAMQQQQQQQQQQQAGAHLGSVVGVGVGVGVGPVRAGSAHHLSGQRVTAPNHPLAPYHPSYTPPQGNAPPQMTGVTPTQRGVGIGSMVGVGVGGARFGTPLDNTNVGTGGGGMANQAVPPAPSPHQPSSGAPSSSQPGPQAATQQSTPSTSAQPQPTASIADPEKRKLIQQQLVLLLHAHKCQRRESQANGEVWQCTLPHCKTMKGVLNHMIQCQTGKSCTVPHCSSSRQIINHWKHCTRNDCPVCLPLKQADRNRNNNLSAVTNAPNVANTTPNPSFTDVKRAYDALGMQCPTSASGGGPTTSLNTGTQQIPAIVGSAPTAANPLIRATATSGNPVRCTGPRPPNVNVPLGSDSSQQNSMTMQLFGISQTQHQNNQPNQTGQSSVSNIANQEVTSQQVLTTNNLPLGGGQVSANPVSGSKEWHQSITSDLRNHLVHKLVQAIFPTPDPTALQDKRMHNLVAYARKVEGDMYEMAQTRSEYYHLLAEKIYKIQKELEEKRQKRKEQQLQAQNNACNNVGVPNSVRPQLTSGNTGLSRPTMTQQQPVVRSHSPGMGLAIPPNRMQFQSNLVGPPGPSPNAHPPTPNSNLVVSNPGLSPFGQTLASPVSNISNSNVSNQFQTHNSNGPNILGNSPLSNQQFPEIMKARLAAAQQASNGTPNSQAPSPYMNQNQFNNRIPLPSTTPTASDQVTMTSQMSSGPTSVGSQKGASPGLTGVASNGPVPPSTPSTPLIPPPLPSPLPQSSQDQISNISTKGMPVSRSSSVLSSQMAALSAAAAMDQEDSPRPPQSHPGMSGGKMEIKQEEDIKKEDLDDSLSNHGGKSVHNEIKTEIKTETLDNSETDIKEEPCIKEEPYIKEEPMSPSSDIKPLIPEPIQNQATDKKRKCVFKPEELRQALMPTLEKLIRCDPESLPFRQPVDPQQLGIPDYFDIVKKPMDLSTIKMKLDTGQYSDPWEYVDDVWLMFDNAWLYNRKTSRVYRYCTKLSEVFEQEIDPVMQNLGYCCGRKYTFNPQVLCCYGKQLCTIPRDAKYFSYQNRYTFCQKCFNDIIGDTVTLGDDPTQPQTLIKKELFLEMKNDHLELEPFVKCDDCGRKQHQICVLHLDQIWPQGFVCGGCLKKKGAKRKENKFNAKRLPTSKLGIYIETRVNNFLKKKEAGAGEVSIRVVASSDKIVEVKPGMRSRFVEGGELPGEFPYRAKALFAFEEIDGADVCFFGMHVQEYGSESPMPNTRRVYIAYLDSVHFFKPRQCRTAVYHEILLGYLDYAKQLGYTMAHIWACPPSEGDDYIFHCHPPEQKIPKPKRLQEWYKKMLDKGIIERIIVDYKDILKQAMEDSINSAADLPYFEGDFWPNVLEESIKELDQEEEEKRKQAEAAEAAQIIQLSEDSEQGPDGKKKGQKKAKKSNKSKAAQRKNSKKHSDQQTGNDLSAKIFATMEKHKEVFFVIRLHSAQSAASLGPIVDPDPLINCDLMDGRDAFLTMARDRHYEFSSMRRAQFSTLCMLWELHNQGQDKFVYTCNSCKNHVETRYHCTVCDDFDLCVGCYEKDGHPHKMEKLGLDLDDGSSPGDIKQANPQEARKLSIQRCIQSLVHACQCRDANCRLPSCQKMKRVVQHTRVCKRKTNGGCSICKQLIALCCYHAKHCQESKCLVPFCSNIKHKLKQQQLQQRLQQAKLLRRRMAVMNTTRTVPGMGTGNSPPPPPAPPALASPPITGAKPTPATHTPPPNVLQVVKQVQEEAARQQAPHYGKAAQQMPPPQQHMQQRHPLHSMDQWGPQRYPGKPQQSFRPPHPMSQTLNHPQLSQMHPHSQHPQHPGHTQQQIINQQNNPQQIMSMVTQQQQPGQTLGQMGNVGGMVGGPVRTVGAGGVGPGMATAHHQKALQQLMVTLRSPTSPEQQAQILQILKSNPPLMAAFIKQRQSAQQNQQQAGGSGPHMMSGVGATGGNATTGIPQVLPQQQQAQQRLQMQQLLGQQQQQQVSGVAGMGQINNMGMNPQQRWSFQNQQQLLNNMQRNQIQQVQQQQGFPTPSYGGRGVGVNVGVGGNARYFTPSVQQLLQRSPPPDPSPRPPTPSEMMLLHQSPAPTTLQPTDDQMPPMTPQDQLTKFVEQL